MCICARDAGDVAHAFMCSKCAFLHVNSYEVSTPSFRIYAEAGVSHADEAVYKA